VGDTIGEAAASAGADLWSRVRGQPDGVAALRAAASAPVHAYLLVGPRGSGTLDAAVAFAGDLLGAGLDPVAATSVRARVGARNHPDLVAIEPDANIWRFPRTGDSPGLRFVREASTSPREADRKVVVAVDFHLARDEAIGRLLKMIEEPPASTVIVLIEDEVPPEQVTIASRCVTVEFGPVPEHLVREDLLAIGAAPQEAETIAAVAGGDLDRARRLLADPEARARLDAWRSVGSRLDGTGATVQRLVKEVQALLDASQAEIEASQAAELAALDAEAERYGEKRRPRKELADRHKRELRQRRTGELVFGLATLALPYRQRLGTTSDASSMVASLRAIQAATEALDRNPIEALLLQSLFLSLTPLPSSDADGLLTVSQVGT
jgi:DNA polymerase-3 subunit delta'